MCLQKRWWKNSDSWKSCIYCSSTVLLAATQVQTWGLNISYTDFLRACGVRLFVAVFQVQMWHILPQTHVTHVCLHFIRGSASITSLTTGYVSIWIYWGHAICDCQFSTGHFLPLIRSYNFSTDGVYQSNSGDCSRQTLRMDVMVCVHQTL